MNSVQIFLSNCFMLIDGTVLLCHRYSKTTYFVLIGFAFSVIVICDR